MVVDINLLLLYDPRRSRQPLTGYSPFTPRHASAGVGPLRWVARTSVSRLQPFPAAPGDARGVGFRRLGPLNDDLITRTVCDGRESLSSGVEGRKKLVIEGVRHLDVGG